MLFGCDYTAYPGQDIEALLNTAGINDVCLSPGSYYVNNQTSIELPAGKTLEGTGTQKSDVIITSNADRVVTLESNTYLKNLALRAASGILPTYGVLSYHGDNQFIWSVDVQDVLIGVGVNGSTNVHIWDTFLRNNGNLYNGSPDPNVWIYASSGVEILYGEAYGRANGPGGDGEVAAHESQNVRIYGMHVIDSGASAIYYVNCDYCSVENAVIQRADEWGLDIVSGSDYFLSQDNTVEWSNWGGSVFDRLNSTGGQYLQTSFISNNRSGYASYCNGINTSVSGHSVPTTGSTVDSGALFCTPWP